MPESFLTHVAPPHLSRYMAPLQALRWTPLGHAGGFSGAELFRGDGPAGEPLFALKLWPAAVPVQRLLAAHAAMTAARGAGCGFVPAVAPTVAGGTVAVHGGRLADVTAWAPGDPDPEPSAARLAAAALAVARLHAAWRPAASALAPAPAVARRVAALAGVPGAPGAHADFARERLGPWRVVAGPVHPTVGDLRLEHVLFTGDAVTGVVDFGAVTADHPAADLARLAADLPPGRAGELVAAYNAAAPEPVAEGFVRALAVAGLAVAAARWAGVPGVRAEARAADRAGRLAAWAAAG